MSFFSVFSTKSNDINTISKYYNDGKLTTKEYNALLTAIRNGLSKIINKFRANHLAIKMIGSATAENNDARNSLIASLMILMAKVEILTRLVVGRAVRESQVVGFEAIAQAAVFFIQDILMADETVCPLEQMVDVALSDRNVQERFAVMMKLYFEKADRDSYIPSHLALLECYRDIELSDEFGSPAAPAEEILSKANALLFVLTKLPGFAKADAVVAPKPDGGNNGGDDDPERESRPDEDDIEELADEDLEKVTDEPTVTQEPPSMAASDDARGSLRREPVTEHSQTSGGQEKPAAAALASTAVRRGSLPQRQNTSGSMEEVPTQEGRVGSDAGSPSSEIGVFPMGDESQCSSGNDSGGERPDSEMGLSGCDPGGVAGTAHASDVLPERKPKTSTPTGGRPAYRNSCARRAREVLDALRNRRDDSVAGVLEAADKVYGLAVIGESLAFSRLVVGSWVSLDENLFQAFREINIELQRLNLDTEFMNPTQRLRLVRFTILMSKVVGVRDQRFHVDEAATSLRDILTPVGMFDEIVAVKTSKEKTVIDRHALVESLIKSFWVGISPKKLPRSFNPTIDPACMAVAIELLEKAEAKEMLSRKSSDADNTVWMRLHNYQHRVQTVLSNPKKASKTAISFVPIWERKQFARQFALAMSMLNITVDLHSLAEEA